MKKLSRSKGFKVTPNGQWEFPGENTLIPSNQITMKGVPYPVFGMDDTGYSQMMYPGMEYTYPGSMVYEIPMAQEGLQTGVPDFNKLYDEYKTIQSQINQYIGNNEGGKKEQEYRLKLNDLANKLVEEGVSIENTDYVPQHIKQDSNSHYCIGSSCYILNQAGENFKYFSNSNFQDDVIAGKVPGRTFDYSAKGIVPGDIIQFKRNKKGSPYHAYLIQDISAPDKDGNRKVIAVGSAGSGPMQNKEYILTKDNKITSEYDGEYDVQTIRRERFDKNIAPNDLLKKRDALKADLEKYYPNYKVADIDEKVFEVSDDPNAIYDSRYGTAFEWNQKNEIYSPATKEINLEDSKINDILAMFSSPDFKKQFMTTQSVSSKEYDAIVKNVIGIYGQETKFGTRKEAPDFIAKSFPGLVSSVGPFQINPKNLKTQKFSREDLFDPIKGAEAAATFLAENLPLLRNRSNAEPGTDTYSRNITKDNYLEYLPYLMNDQRVIRRGDYKNIEKGFPIVQGKSDYKERVDNYIKMLGLESIPISRSAPEYQSGGTFNPDTDEFIGFVDDLPQAQEGLEKKGFDTLTESQKALLQKGNNLDKVKDWYTKYPNEMQNFQSFMNEHNADDYLKLYDTEKEKFDIANRNNAEWHKDWYAKRAQLPQFKDVARQRLNSYSNLDSAKLTDPVNYAFKYWQANNASVFKDRNLPPETFYFPTNKLYGHQSDADKEILINSKLFNEGNYKINNKLYNQAITHEKNHEVEDQFPQKGTVDHLSKNDWKNLSSNFLNYFDVVGEPEKTNKDPYVDPIQRVISYDDILKDSRTEQGNDVYQYQPTEVRSRLDVWRQYNNIDPLKNYSEDEIRSIIQKNLSDPNVPRNIKELYQTIGNPNKLKYLHDSYVSNDRQNPLDRFLPQNYIQKAQTGIQVMRPDATATKSNIVQIDPSIKFGTPTPKFTDAYSELESLYGQASKNYYDKFNSINQWPELSGKTINLTTDRYRGANVPVEYLDMLKESAKKFKIDPYVLYAIAGRESTFGQGSEENKERSRSPIDLVSGWTITEPYEPYNYDRFLADNKTPNIKEYKNTMGYSYSADYDNIDNINNYITKNKLVNRYKNKLAGTRNINYKNPFDFLSEFVINKGIERYNPGDPDYRNKINNEIRLLKMDPEFSKYANQKFGGLVKAQEGKQTKLKRRNQSSEDDVLLGSTLSPLEVEDKATGWARVWQDEYNKRAQNQRRFQENWYPGEGYDSANIERRAGMAGDDAAARYILDNHNSRNDYKNRQEYLQSFTPKEKEVILRSNYARNFEPDMGSRFRRGLGLLTGTRSAITNPDPDLSAEDYVNRNFLSNLGDIISPLSYPVNLVKGTVKGQGRSALSGETANPWLDATNMRLGNEGESWVYDVEGDIVFDPLNISAMNGFGSGVRNLFGKSSKLDEAGKITSEVEQLPGSGNADELVDLWRIQERGARPMSELAAEGKLGPMFQNEKAIQHFKDREKYYGQWFTKDKADFDFYKADREFVDPEIIQLQVPKSRLAEFQNYDKSLSYAPDREFVIPLEQQKLFTPSQPIINQTVTPWSMKELPGLHLKSTMSDGAISKIVEPKTGLINTEQALAIIGKESGGADKVALVKQGLGENIPKKMDYNEFRKVVQDQLIPLERQFSTQASNYGIGKLGYPSPKYSSFQSAIQNGEKHVLELENKINIIKSLKESPDEGKLLNSLTEELKQARINLDYNKSMLSNLPLENQTLILGNKSKFGRGSFAHNNPDETLGHIHFLRDSENPNVLTVTQIQSDAFQGTHRIMPKDSKNVTALDKLKRGLTSMEMRQERNKRVLEKMKTEGVDEAGIPVQEYQIKQFEDMINSQENSNSFLRSDIENFNQKSLLDKNHQERYLQELVNYAGERGDVNKIRLPTSETAAKVQNYEKITNETIGPITKKQLDESSTFEEFIKAKSDEFAERNYTLNETNLSEFRKIFNEYKSGTFTGRYAPEHQTILKKYSEQPKTIKKLFGVEPKIVTDSKGNTWYEFDIPEKFRKGKAEIKAFAKGGTNLPLYQNKGQVENEFDMPIKDNRVWNPVTDSKIVPTRDLKGGVYSKAVIKNLVEAAYRNNMEPDTYTGLAIALQETNLGKTDSNLGHVLNVKPYDKPTAEDDLFRALKENYEKSDKLGLTDPLQRLQTYNGEFLTRDTEKKYHKGRSRAFYGVPIPEEGLDLRKNPLYAKKIVNVRDSVLLQNPQLIDFVNKATNEYANKYSVKKAIEASEKIDRSNPNEINSAIASFAKTNPREYNRLKQLYNKNKNNFQNGGMYNSDTDEFLGFID